MSKSVKIVFVVVVVVDVVVLLLLLMLFACVFVVRFNSHLKEIEQAGAE